MNKFGFGTIIERVLSDYTILCYDHPAVATQVVFGQPEGHYLVMLVGSDGRHFNYSCLVHVRLYQGMVRIERDDTDLGVAMALIAAGIPSDVITNAVRSTSDFCR